MLLAQVAYDSPISVGNLIILVALAIGFFFLWYKTRRDVELDSIQRWIGVHEKEADGDRDRLRATEDAIVRLTALQETTDRRLLSIEHRHERVDERKHI